jgi:hypothetical protein
MFAPADAKEQVSQQGCGRSVSAALPASMIKAKILAYVLLRFLNYHRDKGII